MLGGVNGSRLMQVCFFHAHLSPTQNSRKKTNSVFQSLQGIVGLLSNFGTRSDIPGSLRFLEMMHLPGCPRAFLSPCPSLVNPQRKPSTLSQPSASCEESSEGETAKDLPSTPNEAPILPYMSYSQNSLKGGYLGDNIGNYYRAY